MPRAILFSALAVAAILTGPALGLSPGQALAAVGMAGGFLLAGAIVMAETARAREADLYARMTHEGDRLSPAARGVLFGNVVPINFNRGE